MRKRTAALMFGSCSTADRSRWCAQFAHSQCHNIEEWVSPLQVTFCITRVGSFTSPGIDTREKGPTMFSVLSDKTRAIMWSSVLPRNTSAVTERPGLERSTLAGRASDSLLRHGAPAYVEEHGRRVVYT